MVQRRVRFDNLRGMDPVTLEVTITDVLRRPMSQIEPSTLVDLLALAEADPPSALGASTDRFRERIAREISDIPDGSSWVEFLGELGELPGERVPTWLRERLLADGAREDRAVKSAQQAADTVAGWADSPPEPFSLGKRGVRVAKAAAAARRDEERPDRVRKPRKAAGGGSSAAPKRRAPPVLDQERQTLLLQIIQERLARYTENGLAENVLLIGVRKQAAATDSGVSGSDILAALKELESRGVVRNTARRWILERRW